MKKLLIVLLALGLLGGLSGCGNEMDKGKNRDLDKPQSDDKEARTAQGVLVFSVGSSARW